MASLRCSSRCTTDTGARLCRSHPCGDSCLRRLNIGRVGSVVISRRAVACLFELDQLSPYVSAGEWCVGGLRERKRRDDDERCGDSDGPGSDRHDSYLSGGCVQGRCCSRPLVTEWHGNLKVRLTAGSRKRKSEPRPLRSIVVGASSPRSVKGRSASRLRFPANAAIRASMQHPRFPRRSACSY